jgi:hypothetical protein
MFGARVFIVDDHPLIVDSLRQLIEPNFTVVGSAHDAAGCSKRLSSKAAASEGPEAYPLGRTVRRIRSTTSVRAAESVRRPGPR